MPRKLPKRGESRLSLEGLHGTEWRGSTITSIRPHGDPRRVRKVHLADGRVLVETISDLLQQLLKVKGYTDDNAE